MLRSRFFFILVFVTLLVGNLGALDLIRGKIKLVLHEKSGNYSLYFSEEISNPTFRPLIVVEDPKTSKITVRWQNQSHTMGESLDFKLKTETTASGGRFIWTSRWLEVTQSFEFLTSVNSSVVDGIQINFDFINKSDKVVDNVGLRVIVDTVLGESKDHFKLSSGELINAEARLFQSYPEYLISKNYQNASSPGLIIMLKGGASTLPSQVYIANWKRLDQSDWLLAFRSGRDFNLMPYSFNDSAAALYYENFSLQSQTPARISLVMGSLTAGTFSGARSGSLHVVGEILDQTRTANLTPEQIQSQLTSDRQLIETLLIQLNDHFTGKRLLSAEEIKIAEAALVELEQRKGVYLNQK